MSEPIITVHQVAKKYAVYGNPVDRLKEMVLRRPFHHEFWALRDISFQVHRGQTFGIIGANGSGKSTLLQILAGVMQPTRGRVSVGGRVAALLELGAGFNPEFNGRENVLLNGMILGLSEAEVRRRFDSIVAFADIGDFIDEPVKTYSSGMYVRLAFATAIHVDPDILIVDEALSVGDAYFQQRCMLRIAELKRQGMTLLFVSHDPNAVKLLCDTVILLEQGTVVEKGPADQVVSTYYRRMLTHRPVSAQAPLAGATKRAADPGDRQLETPMPVEQSLPNAQDRFGDGSAELLGVGIYDQDRRRTTELVQGTPLRVRLSARFRAHVEQPNFGVVLKNWLGVAMIGTNTIDEGVMMPAALPQQVRTVELCFQMPRLLPGDYALTIAVTNGTNPDPGVCDWINSVIALTVTGSYGTGALLAVPVAIETWLSDDEPSAAEEVMTPPADPEAARRV